MHERKSTICGNRSYRVIGIESDKVFTFFIDLILKDVQDFFDVVVQPVLENERGYKLIVVDGKQKYEQPHIDQEIFKRLHKSSIVIADITGARLNCYLELGYALVQNDINKRSFKRKVGDRSI